MTTVPQFDRPRAVRVTIEREDGSIYELAGAAAERFDEITNSNAVFAHIHGCGMTAPLPWRVVRKGTP